MMVSTQQRHLLSQSCPCTVLWSYEPESVHGPTSGPVDRESIGHAHSGGTSRMPLNHRKNNILSIYTLWKGLKISILNETNRERQVSHNLTDKKILKMWIFIVNRMVNRDWERKGEQRIGRADQGSELQL